MIFDKFYFPPNVVLPSQTQQNQLEWATPPRGKDNVRRTTGPEKSYVYRIYNYTIMKQHTLMKQHITRPPTPIVFIQPPNV